jgi:hypothetical protein
LLIIIIIVRGPPSSPKGAYFSTLPETDGLAATFAIATDAGDAYLAATTMIST